MIDVQTRPECTRIYVKVFTQLCTKMENENEKFTMLELFL